MPWKLTCFALAACVAGAACSQAGSPAEATSEPSSDSGGAGGTFEGSGGSSKGRASGGARGGGDEGGSGAAVDAAVPGADSAPAPDANGSAMPDANPAVTVDAAPPDDSGTPMSVDGLPPPSYTGQVPIYYGPAVGPVVKMECPGDPTAGWTEYKESFFVEHPYTIPTNTRFSITGGVYNFWVFPNDAPHSPNAQGRNPRTEANYGGTYDKMPGAPGSDGHGHFISGMRMWSADVLLEKSTEGVAIMQIHTTTTGGGPVGLRPMGGNLINNGSLTVVEGSTVTGGLMGSWFNMKVALNADTQQVQIYVNNCLKKTYTGQKGDGHFYFKNGVYFCHVAAGCRSHYKNLHLYTK